MRRKRRDVRCQVCGWQTRRVYRSCECDTWCRHPAYGYCIKCQSPLSTLPMLRMLSA